MRLDITARFTKNQDIFLVSAMKNDKRVNRAYRISIHLKNVSKNYIDNIPKNPYSMFISILHEPFNILNLISLNDGYRCRVVTV